jgi:hypothetical protein
VQIHLVEHRRPGSTLLAHQTLPPGQSSHGTPRRFLTQIGLTKHSIRPAGLLVACRVITRTPTVAGCFSFPPLGDRVLLVDRSRVTRKGSPLLRKRRDLPRKQSPAGGANHAGKQTSTPAHGQGETRTNTVRSPPGKLRPQTEASLPAVAESQLPLATGEPVRRGAG